jgi:hypothetical protein
MASREHPAIEAVLQYAEDRADSGTGAAVAAHLGAGCASCGEAVEFVREVRATILADAAFAIPDAVRNDVAELYRRRFPRTSLLQRLVATLTFDSRLQPALAGARSAAAGSFQLVYEAPPLSIDLACERGADHWRVMGQALPADAAAGSWEVRAEGADETTEAKADDLGIFQLRDLPSGQYTLTLIRDAQEIVLPDVSLTGC